MSWLSKDLTLDLLAIGIHTLNKIYDRVKEEPGEWPAVEAPQHSGITPPPTEPAPTSAPAPADPAPQAQAQAQPQAPQAPAAEAPQQPNRLPEAQDILRTISQNGGREWIKNTLFPQFGVAKLTDTPAEKLPALIAAAQEYQQGAA